MGYIVSLCQRWKKRRAGRRLKRRTVTGADHGRKEMKEKSL